MVAALLLHESNLCALANRAASPVHIINLVLQDHVAVLHCRWRAPQTNRPRVAAEPQVLPPRPCRVARGSWCPPHVHPTKLEPATTDPTPFAIDASAPDLAQWNGLAVEGDHQWHMCRDAIPIAAMEHQWEQQEVKCLFKGRIALHVNPVRVHVRIRVHSILPPWKVGHGSEAVYLATRPAR